MKLESQGWFWLKLENEISSYSTNFAGCTSCNPKVPRMHLFQNPSKLSPPELIHLSHWNSNALKYLWMLPFVNVFKMMIVSSWITSTVSNFRLLSHIYSLGNKKSYDFKSMEYREWGMTIVSRGQNVTHNKRSLSWWIFMIKDKWLVIPHLRT